MEKRGRQDGITTEQAKGRTQRWQPLLPNLRRVNEAARNSGQTRFTALLHHVDVAALERAFRRQRRAASPGMDRVTVDDYERELEANLRRLHDSIHSGQYWPKPVRRTYIPKADGGRRPLGIPALEDKIVQGAVAEVLNAVYEADFMGFSYGFRPERSPHAALAALDKALMTQRVDWVLDVDIRTFFDIACLLPSSTAEARIERELFQLAGFAAFGALSVRGTSGNRYRPGLGIAGDGDGAVMDAVVDPGVVTPSRAVNWGTVRRPGMRRGCDWEGVCRMPCRRRMVCTVLGRTQSRWGERCPAAVSAAAIVGSLWPSGARSMMSRFPSPRCRDRSASEPTVTGTVGRARVAAPPDQAHGDRVRRGAVDHKLVDEAAQERLLAGRGQGRAVPQVGQAPTGRGEGGPEPGLERDGGTGVLHPPRPATLRPGAGRAMSLPNGVRVRPQPDGCPDRPGRIAVRPAPPGRATLDLLRLGAQHRLIPASRRVATARA